MSRKIGLVKRNSLFLTKISFLNQKSYPYNSSNIQFHEATNSAKALCIVALRVYNHDMLTAEVIRKAPKVELHEHLDGSLRPETVLDLARKKGMVLPASTPEALAEWFSKGSDERSLTLYLKAFDITTALMQDRESLKRIAKEEIEDLASDGVVYAEIRFAPVLHTKEGMTMEEVVSAVLEGLNEGKMETGMEFGLILSAMRDQSPAISLKTAELAVAFSDRGVVGFDLAGDEAGNPAKKHIEAFSFIRAKNFSITIHAGEAFGLESIWQAIQICGAHRIGHGTRLTDDMSVEDGKIVKMGSLASFVKDKRIPLEMCLTSNVGTGAASSYSTHPFPLFFRNGFRVFLCTDNRLMSNTSLSKEFMIAVKEYNLTLNDLEKITLNAAKSAFIHYDKRLKIIYDIIKPGYKALREGLGL